MLLEGTAQIKSSDPDPLDTERFASASDYSKGENITPAKAQLQTIVGREKQRVGAGCAAAYVILRTLS